MRRSVRAHLIALAVVLWTAAGVRSQPPPFVQFVYTSDAHYGLTRAAFQGAANVDAHIVNAALVAKINSLPATAFPKDGGLRQTESIGAIDFLVETGDIANRSEVVDGRAIQSAAHSWAQFDQDYARGLTLRDRAGQRASLFVVPGNHDASNAVGFYRAMIPAVDNTAMVQIFNRMMAPAVPRTTATFEYARDKVEYSRDVGGIHFVFVQVWPDSHARAWMEQDVARVGRVTPIVIFTHDQPDAEAKHFQNPNGTHGLDPADRFENLLEDQFRDGKDISVSSRLEQADLETFLRRHPNVSAYFHGNSNWNQFYDWTGPNQSIAVHTFRVDSPMKGAISATDETRLSFQVVTIDPSSRTMTVRECLWNADPAHPSSPIAWGASTTVALFPRPTIE